MGESKDRDEALAGLLERFRTVVDRLEELPDKVSALFPDPAQRDRVRDKVRAMIAEAAKKIAADAGEAARKLNDS